MTPKGPDPARVTPNVYNKVFENKVVHVFDIRFKSGAKAVMHWHPNHLVYVLGDGSLEIHPPKGEAMEVSAKAGDAMWIDSGHHETFNPGATELHAPVIELKGNAKKQVSLEGSRR